MTTLLNDADNALRSGTVRLEYPISAKTPTPGPEPPLDSHTVEKGSFAKRTVPQPYDVQALTTPGRACCGLSRSAGSDADPSRELLVDGEEKDREVAA